MSQESPPPAAGSDATPGCETALSPLGEAARVGDPDRFEAALFEEDLALRERLFTLIAFNCELARTRLRVSEPHLGLIRLAWWREAIEEAEAGAPARAHELAEPLSALIKAAPPGFAAEATRLADAWERDLDPEPFPSLDALRLFLEGSAGRLARLCAWTALGARPGEAAARMLDGFSLAEGAARVLGATAALAGQERSLLPLKGAALAALLRGETAPEARRAAADLATLGLEALRGAQKASRDLDLETALALKPITLASWRAERRLRRALRPGCDLFTDLSDESPFRRRASLLLRGLIARV